MSSIPIFTFHDAGEHIDNVFNPAAKPSEGRDARLKRAAIVNAYRDLPSKHRWTYYQRRTLVVTEASYSTGTVTYDYTGGTYERQLTLSDGTWPSTAARGMVVIDDVHYPIHQRMSDTVVTLGPRVYPTSDISSSSFVWYRDAYPLPTNFLALNEVIDTTDANTRGLIYASPSEHLQRSRSYGGQVCNRPDWYTIRNEGDYVGSLSIVFGRPPSEARSYDIAYSCRPKNLRTYNESTGTITCTAGSAIVGGSSTAFSSVHVGAAMRFTASTTDEPTTVIGNVDGTLNPFLAERIILAVTNTTTLTVDAAPSSSDDLTAAKYTISDLIDIEPQAMLPYFLRLCELEYAKLAKRDDWRQRAVWANEALLEAVDADIRDRTIKSGQLGYDSNTGFSLGDVTVGESE